MTDTTSDDDYKKVSDGSDNTDSLNTSDENKDINPEDKDVKPEEIKIRKGAKKPETKPKSTKVYIADGKKSDTFDPYQVAVAILQERIVYYDSKEDDVYYYKDGIYTEATPLIRGFAVRLMQRDYYSSVLKNIRDILKELSQEVVDNPLFQDNGLEKVNVFIEPPPYWVLFKDCVYNMKTGEIMEQNPAYVFRDGQRIEFNLRGEVSNDFEKIVRKEKGGILNEVQYDLFFEFLGYSFFRSYSIPAYLIVAGDGGNGKSTLFEILRSLFGTSMQSLPFTALLSAERRINLYNTFCNAVSETPPDKLILTEDFKSLTSGDAVATRKLYHTETASQPFYTKYFFFGNNVPEVRDDSHGFSRRIYFIELLDKISGITKDQMLLMLQREDYKRWLFYEAVRGFQRLTEKGSFTSQDGEENGSRRYRIVSNSIKYFLEKVVEVGDKDGYEIERGKLYSYYEIFSKLKHVKCRSKIAFYNLVREYFGENIHEIENQTAGHIRLFVGIRVKENWEENI